MIITEDIQRMLSYVSVSDVNIKGWGLLIGFDRDIGEGGSKSTHQVCFLLVIVSGYQNGLRVIVVIVAAWLIYRSWLIL